MQTNDEFTIVMEQYTFQILKSGMKKHTQAYQLHIFNADDYHYAYILLILLNTVTVPNDLLQSVRPSFFRKHGWLLEDSQGRLIY
jgi:hypothetical protein